MTREQKVMLMALDGWEPRKLGHGGLGIHNGSLFIYTHGPITACALHATHEAAWNNLSDDDIHRIYARWSTETWR
jgi:hypothetical protein